MLRWFFFLINYNLIRLQGITFIYKAIREINIHIPTILQKHSYSYNSAKMIDKHLRTYDIKQISLLRSWNLAKSASQEAGGRSVMVIPKNIKSALGLQPTYRVQHVMKNYRHCRIFNTDFFFSVIQGLVSVLVFGILFYPYFACLTTQYKLIGSLMGFVYSAIRYEAVMALLFRNHWFGLLTCMAGDELHSFCNDCKTYSWMSVVANIHNTKCIPQQLLNFF